MGYKLDVSLRARRNRNRQNAFQWKAQRRKRRLEFGIVEVAHPDKTYDVRVAGRAYPYTHLHPSSRETIFHVGDQVTIAFGWDNPQLPFILCKGNWLTQSQATGGDTEQSEAFWPVGRGGYDQSRCSTVVNAMVTLDESAPFYGGMAGDGEDRKLLSLIAMPVGGQGALVFLGPDPAGVSFNGFLTAVSLSGEQIWSVELPFEFQYDLGAELRNINLQYSLELDRLFVAPPRGSDPEGPIMTLYTVDPATGAILGTTTTTWALDQGWVVAGERLVKTWFHWQETVDGADVNVDESYEVSSNGGTADKLLRGWAWNALTESFDSEAWTLDARSLLTVTKPLDSHLEYDSSRFAFNSETGLMVFMLAARAATDPTDEANFNLGGPDNAEGAVATEQEIALRCFEAESRLVGVNYTNGTVSFNTALLATSVENEDDMVFDEGLDDALTPYAEARHDGSTALVEPLPVNQAYYWGRTEECEFDPQTAPFSDFGALDQDAALAENTITIETAEPNQSYVEHDSTTTFVPVTDLTPFISRTDSQDSPNMFPYAPGGSTTSDEFYLNPPFNMAYHGASRRKKLFPPKYLGGRPQRVGQPWVAQDAEGTSYVVLRKPIGLWYRTDLLLVRWRWLGSESDPCEDGERIFPDDYAVDFIRDRSFDAHDSERLFVKAVSPTGVPLWTREVEQPFEYSAGTIGGVGFQSPGPVLALVPTSQNLFVVRCERLTEEIAMGEPEDFLRNGGEGTGGGGGEGG